MRADKRKNNQIRELKIVTNYIKHAEGSCLLEMGDTRIVCTATFEDRVPLFLKGTGSGWVTAEYGMLPRATGVRNYRDELIEGGRVKEIQRLIGRSLRTITDLRAFGESTIKIDCDVIQADGGTRTASITGGFIVLVEAFKKLRNQRVIHSLPVKDYLAAVSVGIVSGEKLLDLSFSEDSKAEVDMNVCMTGSGKLVEVQGTAEKEPFSPSDLEGMLSLAKKGIEEIIEIERDIVGVIV
ncbi:MAG: ribonuclease PH [Candidatus Ratteibacteria bacterium]|nr:ribonuclease PH [Candidatus Ratteibacteria bacterium]